MMYTTEFTADDEEPLCELCIHCCGSDEFCEKHCGPEHWWSSYKRTETEIVEEEKK